MNEWQLWRIRIPIDTELFYKDKSPLPDIHNLDATHECTCTLLSSPSRDKRFIAINLEAKGGDVIVSPNKQVWYLMLWEFKSLGGLPGATPDPEVYPVRNDVATKLHHPRNRPPPLNISGGINKNDLDAAIRHQDEREKMAGEMAGRMHLTPAKVLPASKEGG